MLTLTFFTSVLPLQGARVDNMEDIINSSWERQKPLGAFGRPRTSLVSPEQTLQDEL